MVMPVLVVYDDDDEYTRDETMTTTRCRQQETGNRKRKAGSRMQTAGGMQQAAGIRIPEEGNK